MMSQPPSLFSLTASSGSEWAGSMPALGRHGGLSLSSVLCWMLAGKTGRWAKVELMRTRRGDGRSCGKTAVEW
jgi:hypothetical protein